jgi:hypothetical protein
MRCAAPLAAMEGSSCAGLSLCSGPGACARIGTRRIGCAPRQGRFRTGLPSRPSIAERIAEAPLTDRLSLTNALADANIDRQKAERIATEIFDAIHDNVATKQDLQALEVKLELVKHQLITRLGGLMVVLAGLLFAALHYWPPHG